MPKYGAVPHWAKLEVDRQGASDVQKMLSLRFPVADFNAVRARLDPKDILSNRKMDAAFAASA